MRKQLNRLYYKVERGAVALTMEKSWSGSFLFAVFCKKFFDKVKSQALFTGNKST
jgi:hypothetical protein